MQQMRCGISACAVMMLCMLVLVTTARAQRAIIAGDSVRVEYAARGDSASQRSIMQAGRVVSMSDSLLRLSTDSGTATYELTDVLRMDRYEKTNKWKAFGIAMAIGVASGTVAYLASDTQQDSQRHDDGCVIWWDNNGNKHSDCRSHVEQTESRKGDMVTYQLIGAGVGLVGWGIGVSVVKGRWTMVVHR